MDFLTNNHINHQTHSSFSIKQNLDHDYTMEAKLLQEQAIPKGKVIRYTLINFYHMLQPMII